MTKRGRMDYPPPAAKKARLSMSGHSKWATIKHKKGAADAKRGKLFTKVIKEITVAARMGGGDPDGNPRLRKAITEAKGAQMPADTITRAIKRGTGELEGVNYEEIIYEGTAPGGTLVVIEVMTDNKNRTVAELRKVFEKHNGALAAGGTAMWAFERKGIVLVSKEAADEEKLMELTMDVGAENVSADGDNWQILCAVSDIDAVTSAVEKAGVKIESSAPGYVPKNKKVLEGRDAEVVLALFEALDDHDDVQNAYADFDVSDSEMQRIAAQSG
jgi:YebC/PmpR family DNA-binding regulatory protein